jgi:hypothetical protein
MGLLDDGQPSPDEMRQMQEEMEQAREDRQTAQQLASQAAMENRGKEPGYWDIIGDPDIARMVDDQELEDYVATEFSNSFALGNISKSDWESWQWQIETEFWTMLNEFKRNRKMGDDDMRIMYGEEKPELTDEMARRHRSAMQVKKMFTSLSVNSRGLRSGTEIHAVAKTENTDDDDEDSGTINSVKNWLSG